MGIAGQGGRPWGVVSSGSDKRCMKNQNVVRSLVLVGQ